MPKSEQIPQDYFKKGESIRAVVRSVDMKNNTPVIILSRTSPEFLAKLLEIEVPEIFDGLIIIRKIVREPGESAKVAVESFDDRIDPVGACVGMKGSRIHGIVRELKNENIDVINWTNNIQLLIQRSLTPAKISSMDLDIENKHADVYLKPTRFLWPLAEEALILNWPANLQVMILMYFGIMKEKWKNMILTWMNFQMKLKPGLLMN